MITSELLPCPSLRRGEIVLLSEEWREFLPAGPRLPR